MHRELRIASTMLYVVSAAAIMLGLVYGLSPTIMPYHASYLGMSHHQLPPRVAALLLHFMRGGSGAFLALGIMLVMIVSIPFRRRETWAWWAILISALATLLPLLVITLQVGWLTPWPVVVILLLLVLIALAITRPMGRRS